MFSLTEIFSKSIMKFKLFRLSSYELFSGPRVLILSPLPPHPFWILSECKMLSCCWCGPDKHRTYTGRSSQCLRSFVFFFPYCLHFSATKINNLRLEIDKYLTCTSLKNSSSLQKKGILTLLGIKLIFSVLLLQLPAQN